MNYIFKILPFWKTSELGIISKIALTYTTFVMGLVCGTLVSLYTLLNVLGNDLIYGLIFLSIGGSLLSHYFFARSGFIEENFKKIRISSISLAIAFCLYFGLLQGALTWLLWSIPLFKINKYFKKNIEVCNC